MRVVSVPGRRIVDPLSQRVIDDAGIEVSEHDPLWARLIADGDVAEAADEAAESSISEAPSQAPGTTE